MQKSVSGDVTLADAHYAVDHIQKKVGAEVSILGSIRFDDSTADRCTLKNFSDISFRKG